MLKAIDYILFRYIKNPGVMMNSERIKFENYNGVLFCDACMDDEFSMMDLEFIREEIRNNFSPSTDVICKESGSYSVSAEVQKTLWRGIGEFLNVIYVVDSESKRSGAQYAAETFMKKYNPRVASTKEAAYEMLKENR
jgi:hypothetical protein